MSMKPRADPNARPAAPGTAPGAGAPPGADVNKPGAGATKPGARPNKGKTAEIKGPKPKAFRVLVHVIEAKDIKAPPGVIPDLIVTASVGNQATKYTQVVRRSTSCKFDTWLEWKMMMTYDEMKKAMVVLTVLNANTDARSDVLGMYEVPLLQLRKQPMGEYFMTWLALYNDPDEYVTEMGGALRVTLVCQGGLQPLPTHSQGDVDEAEVNDAALVLMPPLVRWAHYALFIAIYRIEGLPNMDSYGATDAFVSVRLPGESAMKTKVCANSLNPTYNELLRLPIMLPIFNDKLVISVSDYDQGGYDTLVADIVLSVNEILRRGEIKPYWVNLYGVQGIEGLQSIRERLWRSDNMRVSLETCYKGRMLLAMLVEEVPARLVPKIKSISQCADPQHEPYVIRFDLHRASQVDPVSAPDNSQIRIELQVGGTTMESTPRIVENGLVVWDEMFEERRVELPSDLAQCPDIFINVYFTTIIAKTEQRLGYLRLDLEDVVGFNHAPIFETLTRDPLDPKIAAVPGFLEYRLDFGKESNLPRTPRERIMHPPTRRFELRGHIYQARNLPSMDEDGLANPFAVVTLHGFAGQTKVSEPTCNPQWYETVRVELELPIPTPTTANILVRLYDQDEGGDQLIGRCLVSLLGVDKAFPKAPQWRSIWLENESDVRGEVLCSFQLISMDELKKAGLVSILPPMREVEVEMSIVGVREMLPYNGQPIQAPHIEIDCGDRSTVSKVMRTAVSSKPSGPDANFLETLVIRTRLPEELLYCPQLNVRVFDNVRGATPVVAQCSFDLAPYCEWIKDAPYEHNDRPKVPAVQITDEMSEGSDEEPVEVDARHEQYLHTVYPNVSDANFGFEAEMRMDTPSIADLRAARQLARGRLRGHRVRTLPATPPVIPLGLRAVEQDEDSRVEKPLAAELEHLIIDPPFDQWTLYRTTGSGTTLLRREVGRVKARVRVLEAELKSVAPPKLDLPDLFEQSVYITRAYVTRGINFAPKDTNGLSDPYLVVRNGTHKHNIIDDSKNVVRSTVNPNFYRCFELPTMVPGNPVLTIEVWDEDSSGAQLIGATVIDLENRLFSQEWLEMQPKPVERRYLWSPASNSPQGKLEMWLEILSPAQSLASKPKVLQPPAALECQLRVVVWSVKELVLEGKNQFIERDGSADVFVTAKVGGDLMMQETDVHYGARASAGSKQTTANFNWRFVFQVPLPVRQSRLQVQIWDERSTGANDALAECTLQLRQLYENVQAVRGQVHTVPRQHYKCTHPFYAGQQAKLDMEISMLTREVAEQSIAGIGRGQPNKNPYLPPPERGSMGAIASVAGGAMVGGVGMVRAVGAVVAPATRLGGRSSKQAKGFDEPTGWQAGPPRSAEASEENAYPQIGAASAQIGAASAPVKRSWSLLGGGKRGGAPAAAPRTPRAAGAGADGGAGVGFGSAS